LHSQSFKCDWKYKHPPKRLLSMVYLNIRFEPVTIWCHQTIDHINGYIEYPKILLGIQIEIDGNYKAELGLFLQWNQCYVQALQQCTLTHREAGIVYKQCYLPTVSYPLPATNIPSDLLHRHQAKATTAFLAKMGYHHTMPWAVVYAPKALGGIGFCHLGYKQGVQQTMQLIKYLHVRTTNGALFKLVINTYQLHSGLLHPIIEDTCLCLWIPLGWLSSLWQFSTLPKARSFLNHHGCNLPDILRWIPHGWHQQITHGTMRAPIAPKCLIIPLSDHTFWNK